MVKKYILIAALLIPAAMFAVDDPTVTAVTSDIDQVGTLGGKAYLIAAGLALAGVAIGFIRKAKR
jgi:hypothetical protein